VLAGIFARHEFRDPELAEAEVTVTEVRITPDLKNAIAFIRSLGIDVEARLAAALKRATPYSVGQGAHKLACCGSRRI